MLVHQRVYYNKSYCENPWVDKCVVGFARISGTHTLGAWKILMDHNLKNPPSISCCVDIPNVGTWGWIETPVDRFLMPWILMGWTYIHTIGDPSPWICYFCQWIFYLHPYIQTVLDQKGIPSVLIPQPPLENFGTWSTDQCLGSTFQLIPGVTWYVEGRGQGAGTTVGWGEGVGQDGRGGHAQHVWHPLLYGSRPTGEVSIEVWI